MKYLLPGTAALVFGMLLPWFLPADWLAAAGETVEVLFADFADGNEVVWQSFSSVMRSFMIWLAVLWVCGWLPVGWPGKTVIIMRALLLGFSFMLLCRVDYAYGLLTGILLLLPGEMFLLGSLILLGIPVHNLSASIKKREPCFSFKRYLALGVFCILPAALGSWLKACAGPWFLQLLLGWL